MFFRSDPGAQLAGLALTNVDRAPLELAGKRFTTVAVSSYGLREHLLEPVTPAALYVCALVSALGRCGDTTRAKCGASCCACSAPLRCWATPLVSLDRFGRHSLSCFVAYTTRVLRAARRWHT